MSSFAAARCGSTLRRSAAGFAKARWPRAWSAAPAASAQCNGVSGGQRHLCSSSLVLQQSRSRRSWQHTDAAAAAAAAGHTAHSSTVHSIYYLRSTAVWRAMSSSSLPSHLVVGLPALSPTMESGTITEWKKQEGDTFAPGDVLCLVETDKATVDFEAQEDGVIAKILVQAGTPDVKVGSPIMVTVDDAKDAGAFKDYKAGGEADGGDKDTAASEGDSPPPPKEEAPAPQHKEEGEPQQPKPEAKASGSSSSGGKGGRVIASPLAKALAKEHGYDLASIKGTGPEGRIIAADVREYQPSEATQQQQQQQQQQATEGPEAVTTSPNKQQAQSAISEASSSYKAAKAPGVAAAGGGGGGGVSEGEGYVDIEISSEARDIAAAMVKAKQTIPHYYLTVDLNLSELLSMRDKLNADLPPDAQLTLNDMLIKAAAIACRAVPDVNSSWMDTYVRQYHTVDINVLVSTTTGTVAPIVRDVGTRGLKAISDEVRQLASTASSDEGLNESQSATGTLSVVNLGAYGVKTAAPIVVPPQACMLAFGVAEDRVLPNDDATSDQIYKLAPCMTATLSCDHRVVDGAVGAQWLAAFRKLVENPLTMLL